MHVWFFAAIIKRRNDLADIAWGLGFLLVGVVELTQNETSSRSFLVVGLIALWALRLSSYIGSRSIGKPEDARYQEMRSGWGANWILHTYVKVFWLQGCLLFAISQPIRTALRVETLELSWIDALAVVSAMTGFIIETLADYQKNAFKKIPKNRGKICDVGLWSKSRHPNYFGEIIFWVGIATFSMNTPQEFWLVWLSPALLATLLLKVSGVPLVEKRYAGNAAYEAYKQRTRLLLPI